MKKLAPSPAAPAPYPGPSSARPRRAIRLPEVLQLYPISEAQLYKEIAAGLFPKPFKLTPGERSRAVAWWDTEVEAIVEARAATSTRSKAKELAARRAVGGV